MLQLLLQQIRNDFPSEASLQGKNKSERKQRDIMLFIYNSPWLDDWLFEVYKGLAYVCWLRIDSF